MSDSQSILIVEADTLLRSFVQKKLVEMGCDVDVTDNAEEARVLQQSRQYDLVLKDLPKPFSIDLLEWRLKKQSYFVES